jgi:ferredoxin-NADP reductase
VKAGFVKAGAERLAWQEATVTRIVEETGRVKSYFLKVPNWRGFMAGQHVDVRLTAPDGYQAQRSYSIGSAPEAPEVELVIERLDEGEVSPFFHEIVHEGDTIELRGPIGGHFTWGAKDGGPVLLVGGGSGVVPLMSMLRHRATVAPDVPMVLVYSARRLDEVIFMRELFSRSAEEENFHLILTLTREESADPRVRFGRIDAGLFAGVMARFNMKPRHTYVCGASAFVDAASRLVIDGGVDFMSIKTERYGGDPAREIVVPEAETPTA